MVEFLFVFPAAAGADDADELPADREDDCPEFPTDFSDGKLARLSWLIAVQLKDGAFPHGLSLREKEVVLFKVGLALGFIPLEFQ